MPESRTPLFLKYAVRSSAQRHYRTPVSGVYNHDMPWEQFFLHRFFYRLS